MFGDRRTSNRNPLESLNNPAPPHSADQRHHFQPLSTRTNAEQQKSLTEDAQKKAE
jgi:hypothetical protein